MPLRKRRFEALEDRRLLTAIVGPPLMSPVPAVVAADNPSPTSTAADVPTPSTADTSGAAASDGDSSENYVENSPTATTPSAATQSSTSSSDVASVPSAYAQSTYYTSAADGQNAYNENASGPNYSAKTSHVSYSQPIAVTPILQTAVPDPANVQVKASPADTLNFNLSSAVVGPSGAGLGASAATSPPVARTPISDLARGELEPTDALSEPIASGAMAVDAALTAPIAMASAAGDWLRLPSHAADEPAVAGVDVDKISPLVDHRTPALLIGPVGVNLTALEAGIDAVFDRLERLGEELTSNPGAVRFSQWLVVATGACAAFEYARARYREGGPWQRPAQWPIPLEPRLRRRWLRFRRSS